MSGFKELTVKNIICFFCGANTNFNEKVGRNDTCSTCKRYLKCCRNCKFFDEKVYNACLEPNSERQVDKEAGNFCEYFCQQTEKKAEDEKLKLQQAKQALESLFKNKT